MSHRKQIWVIALSLALTVAVCLHFWGREDVGAAKKPAKKPVFSIAFQGYSNSLSGEKWAILLVTNRDVCTLNLLVPVRVKSKDNPDLEARQILCDFNPFSRRSSCRVAIQLPPSSGPWSFHCPAVRQTWREELEDRLPDWLEHLVQGTGGGSAMGYVDTGWVQQ